MNDAAQFWRFVEKTPTCWLWTGGKNKQGYGQFTITGKHNQGAHRIAWELTHGEIPVGLFVCHRCDNPPCVNPEHLFLGTRADNTRDAIVKRNQVDPLDMDTPKFTMKCLECGREFPPLSWNQKYCDDLCARRAYTQRRKSRCKPQLVKANG